MAKKRIEIIPQSLGSAAAGCEQDYSLKEASEAMNVKSSTLERLG